MQKYFLTALLLATGAPLLKAQQASFFMKIENMSGNSSANNRSNNQISVFAFRDSVDYASHLVSPTGRPVGEHFKHHFATRIPVDLITQDLQKMLENGEHPGKIELTYMGRGNNAGTAPRFTVMINDPVVTGFKLYTADNNPTLYAELTFSGTNVVYTYGGQATNGGPNRTGYNVGTNTPN